MKKVRFEGLKMRFERKSPKFSKKSVKFQQNQGKIQKNQTFFKNEKQIKILSKLFSKIQRILQTLFLPLNAVFGSFFVMPEASLDFSFEADPYRT